MDIFGIIYKALDGLKKEISKLASKNDVNKQISDTKTYTTAIINETKSEIDNNKQDALYLTHNDDTSKIKRYLDLKVDIMKWGNYNGIMWITEDNENQDFIGGGVNFAALNDGNVVYYNNKTIIDTISSKPLHKVVAVLSLDGNLLSETALEGLFMNNTNLKYVLEVKNTENNSFYDTFRGCTNLKEFPKGLDKAISLRLAFANSGLRRLNKITFNCDKANAAFTNCSDLETIKDLHIDCSWAIELFYSCKKLHSIDGLYIGSEDSPTEASEAFSKCSSLHVIDNLEIYAYGVADLFAYCSSLSSIERFKLFIDNTVNQISGSAISHSGLFDCCRSLDNINHIEIIQKDLNLPMKIDSWFSGCKILTITPELNLYIDARSSSIFDCCEKLKTIQGTIRVTDDAKIGSNMFNMCESLQDFNGLVGIAGGYYTFSSSPHLTYQSMQSIINNLGNAKFEKHDLVFRKTPYANLTPDDIAIAVNKGWNVISTNS